MKNKFTLSLLILFIMPYGSCRTTMAERSEMKTLTLQLKGKKYDHLFLRGFPYDSDFMITEGQSQDGFNWDFLIPDSINRSILFYVIKTRPFDFETKTEHRISFKCVIDNDTLESDAFVYNGKMKFIHANYLETKTVTFEYLRVNDTLIVADAKGIKDIFMVDFKEKDSEWEIEMSYPLFDFVDDEHYEKVMKIYDSITHIYPDSKYLISNVASSLNRFKSIDDIKKIYNNFSEENKSSFFGETISNYIQRVHNLLTLSFVNISLPNATTNKLEPIIQNPTKFNLVVFSASWCAPCHKLIPLLKEIYNDLNKNLDLVYVSLDESKTVENWKKLLKEETIPWRSLMAVDNLKEIIDKYNASAIPRILLVYPDQSVEIIDIRVKDELEKLYQLTQQKIL